MTHQQKKTRGYSRQRRFLLMKIQIQQLAQRSSANFLDPVKSKKEPKVMSVLALYWKFSIRKRHTGILFPEL